MIAMLDLEHSTELGSQLVALEQSCCCAVVLGPSKSETSTSVDATAGLSHHQSSNKQRGSHHPC